MSQGLVGIGPNQAEDLTSLTSSTTREMSSSDMNSVRSCDREEKGVMDVQVVPASFHRSNSSQVQPHTTATDS